MPIQEATKRRARGTGSIRKDKKRGVWVGRLPIGRNPNGTTKYIERSDATQKGVVEKLKQAGPPGPATTVSQWAERWLADLGVRAGTADTYRYSVKDFITPTLGGIQVRNLTPHQIESACRKWGEALSPNTVRLTLSHLNTCLEAAVRADLIDRNPVARCRKPPGEKTKINPFSVVELDRIVEACSGGSNLRIISVLATTGCRSGEAIALDVPDWNPTACTISITKTQSPRGRGAGPPKSRNSARTIRVPAVAVPFVTAAIGKRKSGPLFTSLTGHRQDRGNVGIAFTKMLRKLGLARRNLHQLRHSVATAKIAAGVHIGDVAKYLGDAPDTVVKTYLHPTDADPSVTLDRLFSEARSLRCA